MLAQQPALQKQLIDTTEEESKVGKMTTSVGRNHDSLLLSDIKEETSSNNTKLVTKSGNWAASFDTAQDIEAT